MARKVFYSWQSWLPNATNRGFIHGALEGACEELAALVSDAQRPELDHDTQGVPGAPDIIQTILEKIDQSDGFVADVSIVTGGVDGKRLSPNPNVLVELGYALKRLGRDRLLLVMNTYFGPADALPFDLRGARVASYKMAPEADSRAPERRRLQQLLRTGLAEILNHPTLPKESEQDREVVRNLRLIRTEAERMAAHAIELNQAISAARQPLFGDRGEVRRLLHRRFHVEEIDRALLLVTHEVDSQQMLREQLHELRSAARAADAEATRLLAEGGTTAAFHKQVHEILTPARLVAQAITSRLAELDPAPMSR